jgi:hypothetical protein
MLFHHDFVMENFSERISLLVSFWNRLLKEWKLPLDLRKNYGQ